MELFLPGLIIFVLLGIFIFLVLPRMGPLVLGIVSLIALIAAGVHHYHLFSSEYTLSTWQYTLSAYTPWVVLGFALIFVITSATYFMSGADTKAAMLNTVATPIQVVEEVVSNSLESLPTAASATNPVTAAINRSIVPGQARPLNVFNNGSKRTPPLAGLGYSASQV
jgi:hypothetical protein